MIKFTDIGAFYQVVKTVNHLNDSVGVPNEKRITDPVLYRGTVKLHGTNAGVTHRFGEPLIPQSRNREISVEDDNNGFAAFVAGREQTQCITTLALSIRHMHGLADSQDLIIFGEFIGPGIQNGMAVNQLTEKQWVMFAAKVSEGATETAFYIDAIHATNDAFALARIHSVFDVETWDICVDFTDKESVALNFKFAEEVTAQVEEQCTWGKKWGIEGIGEGVVWRPMNKYWSENDLIFKTKGEKHQTVKRADRNKPGTDPEVITNMLAFVEFAVTPRRLDQGIEYLEEMGHPITMASTSTFLKWVGGDVKKECSLELEANDLNWKKVSKFVAVEALRYFRKKVETL